MRYVPECFGKCAWITRKPATLSRYVSVQYILGKSIAV